MKKSVFRELHTYDEPIKKPEPAYAVKEEPEEVIEEAEIIEEEVETKGERKRGRKRNI